MSRDLLPVVIVLIVVLPWVAYLARLALKKVELSDERRQLKERIQVLERIVTDSGARTTAQIEALKDTN